MGTVLKFTKQGVGKLDLATIVESIPRKHTIKTFLLLTWLIVRLALFLVMVVLRVPVTIVCNVISIPALFAFLLSWYVAPIPKVLWGLGVLSFISFALPWFCDVILMMLLPQPQVKDL